MSFNVTGLDGVLSNLNGFITTTLPGAMTKGNKSLVDNIANDTRAESPVDTGAMRASVESTANSKEGKVTVGASYAIYVHNGTSRQRANPFMQRAVDKNIGSALSNYKL